MRELGEGALLPFIFILKGTARGRAFEADGKPTPFVLRLKGTA